MQQRDTRWHTQCWAEWWWHRHSHPHHLSSGVGPLHFSIISPNSHPWWWWCRCSPSDPIHQANNPHQQPHQSHWEGIKFTGDACYQRNLVETFYSRELWLVFKPYAFSYIRETEQYLSTQLDGSEPSLWQFDKLSHFWLACSPSYSSPTGSDSSAECRNGKFCEV